MESKELIQKRDDLVVLRQKYIERANAQISYYGGQIDLLNKMIEESEE